MVIVGNQHSRTAVTDRADMIRALPPRFVLQADISDAIQATINDVIDYIPTVVGALIVLVVGYLVGRVLGSIVTRVLRKIGFSEYVGGSTVEDVSSGDSIARGLGKLVEYYVYFVAILAAADILGIAVLSDLLANLGEVLPVIFSAVIVLVLGFVVGRIVGNVVGDLVGGFDVGRYLGGTPLEGLSDTPGEFGRLVGTLVSLYIYLLTLLAAAAILDIDALSTLLNDFAGYLPALAGGVVVFVVGVWLAEIVEDLVVGTSDGRAATVAGLAVKVFIYYITITIALSTVGIDAEPLTTLFTTFVVAFFGALAVALAIGIGVAVGLGGREFVSENIGDWAGELRGTVSEENASEE